MAKIIILVGRPKSGKTTTIGRFANKLGLAYKPIGCPEFVTWAGIAEEIYMKITSTQEEVQSRISKIFAQNNSIQEKNKAILDGVIQEAQNWIDFLKNKPNAIAIIPFSLIGKELMEDLIIKPLELFKEGNEVKVVYLNRRYERNVKSKERVEKVINKIGKYHTIISRNKPDEQAQELLGYLNLKPANKIEVVPLEQFI